jgi:ComF family protein
VQHVILNIYNRRITTMSVLELAIGWLAPADCLGCGQEGLTLCGLCTEAEVIPFGERCFKCNAASRESRTCDKCRAGSPGSVWITTDYEGIAKDIIQKLKFAHQRAAARTLGILMSRTLNDYADPQILRAKDYLVVPIPTASTRVRERSFDHTYLIAKKISKQNNLAFGNPLKRLGQERQVGARRAERLIQSRDKYFVFKEGIVLGRHILLIDDVVTTGATLQAATAALQKAGAKSVEALVFAKKL